MKPAKEKRRVLPPEEGARIIALEGAGPFLAAQVLNGSLVVIETGGGQYCVAPADGVRKEAR